MEGAIRLGMLGCGSVGDYTVLEPAWDDVAINIAALASRDADKATALAARHGVPHAFGSYQALLDARVANCYVALPNAVHHEWVIAALEAGYPVFCENPIGCTAAQAAEMVAAAKAARQPLIEAFDWRHHPLVARVTHWLASGRIGTLERIDAHFHIPVIYEAQDNCPSMDVAIDAVMRLRADEPGLQLFIDRAKPMYRTLANYIAPLETGDRIVKLEKLRSWTIPEIDHDYDFKDTILYALGLGFGTDPMDEAELNYVYEDGLKAVPSICNTLSHPGFWLQAPELEIDWVKILHGEQSFVMHQPLPAEGHVKGIYRVLSVEDKGPEKGAILTLEKRLMDRDSGTLYYSVVTTVFMRGDGGQGGFGEAPTIPDALPDRPADEVIDLPTMPQIALVYRLSGDYNPIHASPAIARKAGFDRPILHGLCTMGLATRTLLRARCDYDPTRMKSMFVRFSRPVFPGETIRTEIFDEGDGVVRFRCRSVERDVVVLDRGSLTIA